MSRGRVKERAATCESWQMPRFRLFFVVACLLGWGQLISNTTGVPVVCLCYVGIDLIVESIQRIIFMLLHLLFATVLCATSLPKTEPNAADCQALLAGVWHCNVVDAETIEMTISENRLKLAVIVDGRKKEAWTGTMVVSDKEPERHLDWKNRLSVNGAIPDNQCLYRLVGNTLLLIGGGPNDRPMRFLSGEGTSPKTLIFTRVGAAP